MPKFKNHEEYQKWKAERAKEIKENPNRKTTESVAKSQDTTKSVSIASIKKTVAAIRALLHNWSEASKRRKAAKKIRQQEQLQKQLQIYKKNNRKMNCPSCRTSISVNAVACPKCGQPITDSIWQKEILRKQSDINVLKAIVLIPIALFICLIVIGVIFSPGIAKRNAERDAELVAEVHNLTPDIQQKFIDNIKVVLYALEHYENNIPYFETTGNNKVDEIFKQINEKINKTNMEINNRKKRAEDEIAALEKKAEALRYLATAMAYAPKGSDYVEQLANVGERIDYWKYKYRWEPIDTLKDDIEGKLKTILHKISPESKTITTKPENLNLETKADNEKSDINKVNEELQKPIAKEFTEFLLETKEGKILRWSNYTEETNNYCTYESFGKFCVPKSDVVSIKEKTNRKMQ